MTFKKLFFFFFLAYFFINFIDFTHTVVHAADSFDSNSVTPDSASYSNYYRYALVGVVVFAVSVGLWFYFGPTSAGPNTAPSELTMTVVNVTPQVVNAVAQIVVNVAPQVSQTVGNGLDPIAAAINPHTCAHLPPYVDILVGVDSWSRVHTWHYLYMFQIELMQYWAGRPPATILLGSKLSLFL